MFCRLTPRVNTVMSIPALSNHARECPLLGVKQTSTGGDPMSAFDPKRTLAANFAAMHAFNSPQAG
jgi:hypothetical protein